MEIAVNTPAGNRYILPLIALMTVTSALFLTTAYPAAALLPGLAIMALLLVDRYPLVAFMGIIVMIPFGEYRHLEGPLHFIRAHWILGGLLVGFIFLHTLPTKNLGARLASNLWPSVVCLFVVHVLAAVISPFPRTAFANVALTAAAYTFVAVGIYFLPHMRVYRHLLPTVLIWSVSIGSAFAVIGYFAGLDFFTTTGGRGLGGAPDPNNMSLMIIFILPLVIHWLLHAPSLGKRVVAAGLLGLNLMGIVTTYSRGGVMILVIATVVLLLEYHRRLRPHHLGFMAVALAVIAGLAWWLVPPQYWQRQQSVVEASDPAMLRRASYPVVAFEAFKERPLLGHGPGAFQEIYAGTDYAERFKKRGVGYAEQQRSKRRHAHNTYLEILVGTGIIGLLPFLALLFTALRNFTRARRQAAAAGDQELAILTGSYRLSYISLLFYLVILSEPYHKLLLLTLPLSYAALVVTAKDRDDFARNPDRNP